MDAPALTPVVLTIADLTPDPRNARLHDEANLASIRKSLATFGQRKPIVVNGRTMVVEAGNGTVEAARSLGWPTIVAVVVDDDEATAAAYGFADNRTAELAAWDFGTLGELMTEFPQVDWSGLGWDAGLTTLKPIETPASTPQPKPARPSIQSSPTAPVSQPGDVWLLGDLKIECGPSSARLCDSIVARWEQQTGRRAERDGDDGTGPRPTLLRYKGGARDGDKDQARRRVYYLVERGLKPHANDLACVDCGHRGDDKRHEYDHHLGYAAEHHEDVESVCTTCHHAREKAREEAARSA